MYATTAHYILTADIDLSGYENWEPIGAFQSRSNAPEDEEVPHPNYAFTGTFKGDGHTISNLTVATAVPMGAGLFNCASGTERCEAYIGGFTMENVNVSGGYLVGGLVGAGKEKVEGSDVMSSFVISDCDVSGTITGGGACGCCGGRSDLRGEHRL